ncbi:putative DNA-binding protein [Bradyrhizobium sp. LM4.3]
MGGAAARRWSILKSPGARSFPASRQGEYRNISFIHEIVESSVEDVTEAILAEAVLPRIAAEDIDLQAIRLDHARDLRKHERT